MSLLDIHPLVTDLLPFIRYVILAYVAYVSHSPREKAVAKIAHAFQAVESEHTHTHSREIDIR